MSSVNYVHEGVEVVKTGKKAGKKLASGRYDELVEITPANNVGGIWKKWVRESDLYSILLDGASDES